MGGVLEVVSEHRCFGGRQLFFRHFSRATASTMTFAAYLPPQAAHGRVPVLHFLSGLSCSEQNFTTKAGAQRHAAEHGVALVVPDTSPRGLDLPGEVDLEDFGPGAGFYVDATVEPWSRHYRMYDYVTRELPELVAAELPVDATRQAVFGHSMGGHGALVCALRNPGLFRSVSAFAPIVTPIRVPWGQRALEGYLGPDRAAWPAYDASELVRARPWPGPPILVDQGTADPFLGTQLEPDRFAEACSAAGVELELRMQPGYDHGYWFVSTFVGDHVARHARFLYRAD